MNYIDQQLEYTESTTNVIIDNVMKHQFENTNLE